MNRVQQLFGLGIAVALTGCGPEMAALSVSLKVEAPASAATAADVCGNTLSSAQLVIRKLELKHVDEDVSDVETGPYLIDLNGADFNGMFQQDLMETLLPVGTYDEVRFEVHKLDDGDDTGGDAGLQTMLDDGVSIRVTGTSAGGDLFYESSVNERQDRAVTIEVGDSVTGIDNVTLTIDPAGWFQDVESSECLDSSDAQNNSRIEDAIKASIDLEEDDDADGVEDNE